MVRSVRSCSLYDTEDTVVSRRGTVFRIKKLGHAAWGRAVLIRRAGILPFWLSVPVQSTIFQVTDKPRAGWNA